MIRTRVLWVLHALARADDRPAARREVYPRLDPLVRGRVRRRVQRVVAEVLLTAVHADDEAHVHRLAFLEVLGEGDGTLDPATSAERFAAHPAPPEPGHGTPTAVLVVAALGTLLCLGAAGWWLTRPPPDLRETLVERNDAWTAGGRPPAGAPEVTEFFARSLPEWVVLLDHLRATRATGEEPAEALARVDDGSARLVREATAVADADFASFVHAVLVQARDLVAADQAPASDSHVRSVDALNAAIAERGWGYYVDAEVLTNRQGRNRVHFSTFRVERVRFYRSGAERVRVLTLTRLDDLNVGRSVLGFTREQVRDALVLQERVERHMVDYILPSLGADARMPLLDDAAPPMEAIERAAATDARELAVAIAGDDALVLGELMARRRALFDRWQERYAESLVMRRPGGVDMDLESYAALEARLPGAEWRELLGVQDDLEDEAVRRAYGLLERAFADSIERHEAQHRLDFGADVLRAPSPRLDERLGAPTRADGGRDRRAWHRRAELSAYLSEIARSASLARTNLALIGRTLYARHDWGSAESAGAVLIFEGLARQLGIAHEDLVVRGGVQREALGALHQELRSRTGEALANAAAALWAELYGQPLPPLESEAVR